MQDCINNMYQWSRKWAMEFNIAKCKVLHLGTRNAKYVYTMDSVPLMETDIEKDIGVHMHKSLKPSDHCAKAAGTARGVLYRILKCFHFRDKVTFLSLYKTYVRPHLEFAAPIWNPWLAKDINILEKVQQKFVKNVSGLTAIDYEGRLIELKLLSLADRRLYLDLVEVYRIVYGLSTFERRDCFTLVSDMDRRPTRGTDCPLNIVLERSNLEVRRNFFTQRVANSWNGLPTDLKMSIHLKTFKASLKDHLLLSRSELTG